MSVSSRWKLKRRSAQSRRAYATGEKPAALFLTRETPKKNGNGTSMRVRIEAIDTLILSNPDLIDRLISSKSRIDKTVLAGFAYYILAHGGDPGDSKTHKDVNRRVLAWLLDALAEMHSEKSPNDAFGYNTPGNPNTSVLEKIIQRWLIDDLIKQGATQSQAIRLLAHWDLAKRKEIKPPEGATNSQLDRYKTLLESRVRKLRARLIFKKVK